MAVKYICNTKKMAFKFSNGKVLDKKGVLVVDEDELARMEKDYFFASLKERGVISVSLVKPSDYSTPGEIIAADNARITELEKENAELRAKIEELEATGKETATVIDSAEPLAEEETEVKAEKTTSKKGSKK